MNEKLVKDILEELQEINSKLDMIRGSCGISFLTLDLLKMTYDIIGCDISDIHTSSLSELSGKLDVTYSAACDIQKSLQHKRY